MSWLRPDRAGRPRRPYQLRYETAPEQSRLLDLYNATPPPTLQRTEEQEAAYRKGRALLELEEALAAHEAEKAGKTTDHDARLRAFRSTPLGKLAGV
jgi:hypothetical protein